MSLIDLSEIDFYKLKSRGYSKIVFDKDNTLTAPYSVKLHPPFTQAWADCKNVFGVENIVIVSNSAGSPDDAGFRQAIEIEQSLGVSVLHHVEKKPGGQKEVLDHFKVDNAKEIIVVGDRVLTDVVYGNMMGAMSILCTRIITEKGDNYVAAKLRKFEKWLI